MNRIQLIECLNSQRMSLLWTDFLEKAEAFDPLHVEELSCVVPIPETKETALFSKNHVYRSKLSALEILKQLSEIHNFPEYKFLSLALKQTGHFGGYKLPWVCPFFSLMPLERTKRTIWINPLKIDNISTIDGEHCAKMIEGPHLVLPISRAYTLVRGEIACAAFSSLRRDIFYFTTQGKFPTDYLTLPDTPFIHSLRKRPQLQKFSTRVGELSKYYQKAVLFHYYDQLTDDPNHLW